ncbi:MAG: MJ1255/VC2487 family glycosyltransferase [Candidatus Aenigmatarchaeota archaeon]
MNVLICPSGEGLGHTTRCRALAEEFIRQRHKVAFAAYGSSAEYLRRYKFKVYDSDAEISLAGKSGKFSMRHTLMNSKGIFYKMLKAAYKECRAIEDFKADIVISDSKYSALFAAKIKGLKSIIIINQNTMSMHGIKKFIGYVVYGSIKNLNKIADRIVVPDFAPPYTVCEYNISQKNNKMYFSGPLIVSEKWRNENRGEKYVLSLIGGFGYRSRILKKINMLALKRKDKMFKLVCGISRINGLKCGKNIEIINFAKNMDQLWTYCEMVVAHGGHSTLMEMACFGKPGIIVPDAGHFEQENNARKISELGCGITVMHKDLSLGSLNNAINQISKNVKYKSNAKKLGMLARKYDAKKTIVKMALSLSESRAKPTSYWKKIFLQN